MLLQNNTGQLTGHVRQYIEVEILYLDNFTHRNWDVLGSVVKNYELFLGAEAVPQE